MSNTVHTPVTNIGVEIQHLGNKIMTDERVYMYNGCSTILPLVVL